MGQGRKAVSRGRTVNLKSRNLVFGLIVGNLNGRFRILNFLVRLIYWQLRLRLRRSFSEPGMSGSGSVKQRNQFLEIIDGNISYGVNFHRGFGISRLTMGNQSKKLLNSLNPGARRLLKCPLLCFRRKSISSITHQIHSHL